MRRRLGAREQRVQREASSDKSLKVVLADLRRTTTRKGAEVVLKETANTLRKPTQPLKICAEPKSARIDLSPEKKTCPAPEVKTSVQPRIAGDKTKIRKIELIPAKKIKRLAKQFAIVINRLFSGPQLF